MVKYNSYMLCHVHGFLNIHYNANSVLQLLYQSFLLKLGYDDPDTYLGTKLHKMRTNNGVLAWAMQLTKYFHDTVRNSKAHLATNYSERCMLPERGENPFVKGNDPLMDVSLD